MLLAASRRLSAPSDEDEQPAARYGLVFSPTDDDPPGFRQFIAVRDDLRSEKAKAAARRSGGSERLYDRASDSAQSSDQTLVADAHPAGERRPAPGRSWRARARRFLSA
jgi:hypothetical protein